MSVFDDTTIFGSRTPISNKLKLLGVSTRSGRYDELQAFKNTKHIFGLANIVVVYPNREAQLENTKLFTQYKDSPATMSYFDWLLYCQLDEQDSWGGITEGPEPDDNYVYCQPIQSWQNYIKRKLVDGILYGNGFGTATGNLVRPPNSPGVCGMTWCNQDVVDRFHRQKAEERAARLKPYEDAVREARAALEAGSGGGGGSSSSVDSVLDTMGQGGVPPNNKFYFVIGPDGTWVKCWCDGRRNDLPSYDDVMAAGGGGGGGDSSSLRDALDDAIHELNKQKVIENRLKAKEDALTDAQIMCANCRCITFVSIMLIRQCLGACALRYHPHTNSFCWSGPDCSPSSPPYISCGPGYGTGYPCANAKFITCSCRDCDGGNETAILATPDGLPRHIQSDSSEEGVEELAKHFAENLEPSSGYYAEHDAKQIHQECVGQYGGGRVEVAE